MPYPEPIVLKVGERYEGGGTVLVADVYDNQVFLLAYDPHGTDMDHAAAIIRRRNRAKKRGFDGRTAKLSN